jgi:quercetin dioxygenase-like cupin family protein
MRPGDTVHTPPGEEHWHGALPDHFVTHLDMWDDDNPTWGASTAATTSTTKPPEPETH